MKVYSVVSGDGKGYYKAGYSDIACAQRALDFAHQHDPRAYIKEHEVETPEEEIERLKSELAQVKAERDRYWNWIKAMGCETCSGDCGNCDGTSGWLWSGEVVKEDERY